MTNPKFKSAKTVKVNFYGIVNFLYISLDAKNPSTDEDTLFKAKFYDYFFLETFFAKTEVNN